jgi:predicted MFS family arabinose efflux permease
MKEASKLIGISTPYLIFTISDGALRILTVLAFHRLGFSPFQIASLFILYEVAGIFTNFLGGWIGAAVGLNKTLIAGLVAQVIALSLLTIDGAGLTVIYVMLVQGLAGIAKDLIKVSSKSSIKALVAVDNHSRLFTAVAYLTGSKNALKGLGFLLGGVLLAHIGFKNSMLLMAIILAITSVLALYLLPKNVGKATRKIPFKHLFSKSRAINVLSLSRFFLFGSRDLWFVIGLPLFLQSKLQWPFEKVSAFLALWIVGYGLSQTLVPTLFSAEKITHYLGNKALGLWTLMLTLFPILIALSIMYEFHIEKTLVIGLLSYGVFFAINSVIHSYLVLRYSSNESISTDVGFYYMSNAMGRLVGTLLSGLIFQAYGLSGALWVSVFFLLLASIISFSLPKNIS